MTALMRWDPWMGLRTFEREVERMLQNLFEPVDRPSLITVVHGRDRVPACDVVTRGEDLVVRVELPGVDREKDLEITLGDRRLCVWGERRFDDEEKVGPDRGTEMPTGAFERAVRVPQGLKPEDIKATCDIGILEVTLPGAAGRPEAQRIPIKVGGAEQAPKPAGQEAA
jgi:HSP20 family protein